MAEPVSTRITRRIAPLLVALLAVTALSFRYPAPEGEAKMGLNLSGVVFYSPEVVFKDVFKQGSSWISQKKGEAWGKGGKLELTPEGWPAKLEPEHFAEMLVFPDLGGKYPQGEYICTYEGDGDIEFGQAASLSAAKETPAKPAMGKTAPAKAKQGKPPTGKPATTKTAEGKLAVTVKGELAIALRVMRTDPKNPVRNIRLYPAKYTAKELENPFDPAFLKRLEGLSSVRFMDWGHTNDNKVSKWSDRTKPTDAFQGTDKGVAWEYQIDLANVLKIEPWFCLPHLADDDYVREFAKLVKARLDPALKFHVEYSNETWNGQFEQARYCRSEGMKLKLSDKDYEAQLRYSSKRSVEIFKIVEKEFGGTQRFTRVIATHSVNTWGGKTELEFEDAYKHADAVAIAPYFGGELGSPKTVKDTLQGGLDGLFAKCSEEIEKNRKFTKEYADMAAAKKLKLFAYEGGQHLVGIQGEENNEELMKLYHAANRDPRMKDLYLKDLKNWKEDGGGLHCTFASMGKYSKWGSWGLLENSIQDEATAPKWQALRATIDNWRSKGN